jgi:DNA primase catalytic subunit
MQAAAKPRTSDFTRQCERQLKRSLAERIRFGFFRNPDPVRDANVNRSFNTLEEYRRFCEANYPAHFGYARAEVEPPEQATEAPSENSCGPGRTGSQRET